MIEHFLDGELKASELWSQHNEHRPLVFRVSRLFFVWASNWNLVYEMYFSLLVTVIIFLVLVWLIEFSYQYYSFSSYFWLFIFAAVFNWSPNQWENFLWAHQLSFFFQNLFALLCLAFMTCGKLGRTKTILSVFFALLSAYSSGAGIFLWPVGLTVIAISDSDRFRLNFSKKQAFVFWILSSIIALSFYFLSYATPSGSSSLLYGLYHPLELGIYLMAYIGSVFVFHHGQLAVVLGFSGLVSWLSLMIWLFLRGKFYSDLRWRVFPWIAIGNYTIFTGLMTGVARVHVGFGQSVSSRYMSIAIMFWISLAALVGIISLKYFSAKEGSTNFHQLILLTEALVLSALMIMCIRTGYLSLERWRIEYEARKTASQALLVGDFTNDALDKIYWDKNHLPKLADILRERKLSLFDAGYDSNLLSK
jgi:hypothetical protein